VQTSNEKLLTKIYFACQPYDIVDSYFVDDIPERDIDYDSEKSAYYEMLVYFENDNQASR